MWFRRDLRLADNPALLTAIENADEIVPLFILDPNLIKQAGNKRLTYLANSLRALNESLEGRLHVIAGDQVEVLKSFNPHEVHISKEFEPYGAARDKRVLDSGINLIETGSPYAVAPGRVRKPDDTNYRVYTPFYKGWMAHGWRGPVAAPKEINAIKPKKSEQQIPEWTCEFEIPKAGEAAALERFNWFKKNALDSYDEMRNMADTDGTSRMSAHLKFGEVHPRTLLYGLNNSKAHDTFRKEIAWREFYADVLFHNPHTIDEYYVEKFANMRYEEPGENFKAWCEGRTGYPFVDAAMRQLINTGWMHNRTRMVVASFLVKDLHIESSPDMLYGRGSTGPLAVQMADALGCRPIFLIGMDCICRGKATDFYGTNRDWKPHTTKLCESGLKWISTNFAHDEVINLSASPQGVADATRKFAKFAKGRDHYLSLLRRRSSRLQA